VDEGRTVRFATALLVLFGSAPGYADESGHRRFERFLLPAIGPDRSISCAVHLEDGKPPERWKGRMDVDGHATEAPWPELSPQVFRLAIGRYVLHDRHSGNHCLYLWDAVGRKLSSLGAAFLTAVAGLGQVPVVYDAKAKTVRICDFDPKLPVLRTIWSAPSSIVTIVGHSGGSIVALVQSERTEDRILILAFGQKPVEKSFAWHGYRPAGSDSVRGQRMLVVSGQEARPEREVPFDFTVDVAILNLKSGDLTVLGKAKGGWDMQRNLPSPIVSVRWIRERPEPMMNLGDPPLWERSDAQAYGGAGACVVEGTNEFVTGNRGASGTARPR
jgi:hypothetical protein